MVCKLEGHFLKKIYSLLPRARKFYFPLIVYYKPKPGGIGLTLKLLTRKKCLFLFPILFLMQLFLNLHQTLMYQYVRVIRFGTQGSLQFIFMLLSRRTANLLHDCLDFHFRLLLAFVSHLSVFSDYFLS